MQIENFLMAIKYEILIYRHTSRPTKGEVFMEKDIFTVGSSTLMEGSGFPDTLSATVSPIWVVIANKVTERQAYALILKPSIFTWISEIPHTAHISPASTLSAGILLNLSYT